LLLRVFVDQNKLPKRRQRVLLLVGSYDEARRAREFLENTRPDWRERVLHLVPDDDRFDSQWQSSQVGLQRGMVSRFAETDAWILIAPLLAVERGHNILNEDNQAAIGAVYFLVRPHPRPDDISYAIQSIKKSKIILARSGILSIITMPRWHRRQRLSLWFAGLPAHDATTHLAAAYVPRYQPEQHISAEVSRAVRLGSNDHTGLRPGMIVQAHQQAGTVTGIIQAVEQDGVIQVRVPTRARTTRVNWSDRRVLPPLQGWLWEAQPITLLPVAQRKSDRKG
jgi:hypothetical protein